jgi:multidrug efflux pump subunit AcrA (membrane-fusion protein)
VRQVVPMGENAARTFPVKVGLEDREGVLKPGMSVAALVPTAEREMRVTVPRDSVLRGPMGEYVWAESGGAALRVGVEVLFGSAEHYAVRVLPGPPLRPGMSVVVEGGERVMFPGQPLKEVRAPAGVAPPRLPGTGG